MPTFESNEAGKVLLLVDWDNLFISLMRKFRPEKLNIEHRIKILMRWTSKIGELLGGRGFIFAPEHMSFAYKDLCVACGLQLIICPKKTLSKPEPNPKTRRMESVVDTVDATIIWYADMMLGHKDFKTICLVSGDKDYVPLFEKMRRCGIRRALAVPTTKSMATDRAIENLVDLNPITGKKMILRLDQI